MAYHNVLFPTDIARGFVSIVEDHVSILTLANGMEPRNIDWSKQRQRYRLAHEVKDPYKIHQLIAFFRARRGAGHSFPFLDWLDYKLPFYVTTPGDSDALPTFMTTDGSTSTFQLVKTYPDTAAPYVRTIEKPISGTLTLYNNGVLTTDWSVNVLTGVVTLGGTLAATTGRAITGYCQFYTPVRFDIQQMEATAREYGINDWANIQLVEVKGE
mgnify:CR=1 FL=1